MGDWLNQRLAACFFVGLCLGIVTLFAIHYIGIPFMLMILYA